MSTPPSRSASFGGGPDVTFLDAPDTVRSGYDMELSDDHAWFDGHLK